MTMFEIKIVTPHGIYDEIQVSSVTLPTTDGQRTVLPNHMPLVMPLEIGNMYLKKDNERVDYAISEGMFTFENNCGTLIITSIERGDEIDFERAEKAKQRAEERLHGQHYEDHVDFKRAELAMKRSLSRLRLKK
ncbi:ATP synthase F1 subunit epsilon [Erysipelothrix inopinata]